MTLSSPQPICHFITYPTQISIYKNIEGRVRVIIFEVIMMRQVNPHELPDGSKAIIKLASPTGGDTSRYMFGVSKKMLEDNLAENAIIILICASCEESLHVNNILSKKATDFYERVHGLEPNKKGVWVFHIFPDGKGNAEVCFTKGIREKW